MKIDHEIKRPLVITVGKYAGTPIDQLPNSYLRWMMGQKFPKAWLVIAKMKLDESDHSDTYISVSRHAIDMYSKRFLHLWSAHIRALGDEGDGLGTFIATQAQEAWNKGSDVSKHRHKDDGTVKDWLGIKWVFNMNPDFPDYKDLITVMNGTEE